MRTVLSRGWWASLRALSLSECARHWKRLVPRCDPAKGPWRSATGVETEDSGYRRHSAPRTYQRILAARSPASIPRICGRLVRTLG
ncbi:hypothetical protein C8F01DRAFT_1155589 [Mycena amicta]|nr:hypothetical protein C8F01DRAFT_1155589 [Mycena amicta]